MNELVSAAAVVKSDLNGHNGTAAIQEARRLRGVAVVGLGYWGPNWVRNFYQLQCADRVIACDLDDGRCERIRNLYPSAETDLRFEDVLEDPDIEGVIIATPVSSHYPMARRVLEAGKSVLVEKPLAMSPARGGRANAARAPARGRADGRAYVRVQRAGAQNSRGHIGGRVGRCFLRQLDPREPRTLPARRQRRLGSRHARYLDHPHAAWGGCRRR